MIGYTGKLGRMRVFFGSIFLGKSYRAKVANKLLLEGLDYHLDNNISMADFSPSMAKQYINNLYTFAQIAEKSGDSRAMNIMKDDIKRIEEILA